MKTIFIKNENVTDLEKSVKITGAKLGIYGHGDCYLETGDIFLPKSQITIIDSEVCKEISLPNWLLQKIASENLSKMDFPEYNKEGVRILGNDNKRSTLSYLKKNIEKVTIC